MGFAYKRRHWWWTIPPVLSILSGFACVVGLVTNHWVVLTPVPYASGNPCEVLSAKTGLFTTMLLSGNFCEGGDQCGGWMVAFGVFGSVGAFMYIGSGAYGLWRFCVGGFNYARGYYHGIAIGFLCTVFMLVGWVVYMFFLKGSCSVYRACSIYTDNYTCVGYSVWVFVAGSCGGLLCWLFMCMPVLEHMTNNANTPLLPVVSATLSHGGAVPRKGTRPPPQAPSGPQRLNIRGAPTYIAIRQ